jgi:hypothetical protein
METGNIIAGAPKVHADLEKLLKPFLGPVMADTDS